MVDKTELHGGQPPPPPPPPPPPLTSCMYELLKLEPAQTTTHIPSACFHIIIVVSVVKCVGNSYTVKPNKPLQKFQRGSLEFPAFQASVHPGNLLFIL